MALRDFDRVRERRVLRVERRHVIQAGLALSAVVGGAFYVGWQQGNSHVEPPTVTRIVVAAKTVDAPPLPFPRNVNDHRPPILPTPVASEARARVLAERRAVPLAPILEEAAGRVGREAVASDRHELRPRLDEATVDSEHVNEASGQVEEPPVMLGALPAKPIAKKRKTAKSVALREAFADREDHRDGLNGEVPADFVQSRPPVADAESVDPALQRSEPMPSFGLLRGMDSEGAALHTPVDAGGISLGQPAATRSTARMNAEAQKRLVQVHLDRLAKARAQQAAKLAAEQRAADLLRRKKLAELEAAKAAKLAKEKALAEAKARKIAALEAAKAAKLAAKKAAEEARKKRLAEAKAKREAERERVAKAQAAAKVAAQLKRAAQQAEVARLRAAAKVKADAAKAKALAVKTKALAAKRQLMERQRVAKAAAAKAATMKRDAAKKARAVRVAKAKPADTRMYWVQIKSLKDGAEAKAFVTGLRSKGYKLTLTVANVPKMGTFHRVRLGPFRGQAAAKQAQQRFQKREQMEAMVMSANRSH